MTATGAQSGLRLAYADPPYPGQSARWYARHPDFAGEVDHAALVARLERDYPDGWALSTSSLALQYVLALCPQEGVRGFTKATVGGVRVAAWLRWKPAPRGTSRVMVTWEPVIVRGGRQLTSERDGYVWDAWSSPPYLAGERDGFAGSKPPGFAAWVAALLGATHDDTIDDLFSGTGAIAAELRQTRLAV